MTKQAANVGPVVATLNLKGGVGKTTVSAHVFRMVWEKFRVPTLLIDFDPQFNLSQTLFDRGRYDRIRKRNKTVMAVMEPPPERSLFRINTSSEPPPEPDDVSTRLWVMRNERHVDLRVLPGDFRLVKYSLMNDHSQLDAVERRFLAFMDKCRQGGRLTVLDCNPGSSFLTRCALRVCTHLLVPIRPDRYSILGVELLDQFVRGVPTVEPKPKKLILLNGVPWQHYDRSIEDELRRHKDHAPAMLIHKIHHLVKLQATPDYTGFATDEPGPYKSVLRREIDAVAGEIGEKLGLA